MNKTFFQENETKSRFDSELDSWIDSQLDSMDFEGEAAFNPLVSPKLKREQEKAKLKEKIQDKVIEVLSLRGIEIVYSKGSQILNAENYETLIEGFEKIRDALDELRLNSVSEENQNNLLPIEETYELLNKIAIDLSANFNNEDALAIYALLLNLNPGNRDCLYHMGMEAQTIKDIPLAIKFYSLAVEADPSFIEAHLFKAECHLLENDFGEAVKSLQNAKTLSIDNIHNPLVTNFIKDLEEWLSLATKAA